MTEAVDLAQLAKEIEGENKAHGGGLVFAGITGVCVCVCLYSAGVFSLRLVTRESYSSYT